MVRESEIREGELAVEMPPARDGGLVFIGRIRTPWTSRLQAPRQGRHDGPVCRLEIFEPWVPALKGVDFYSNLEVIYWLHLSRRDLDRQAGRDRGQRGSGARPRLPRRDAIAGPQARPLRVHPTGAATGRGFRGGVRFSSSIASEAKQSTETSEEWIASSLCSSQWRLCWRRKFSPALQRAVARMSEAKSGAGIEIPDVASLIRATMPNLR
jgi:hypothetical protein